MGSAVCDLSRAVNPAGCGAGLSFPFFPFPPFFPPFLFLPLPSSVLLSARGVCRGQGWIESRGCPHGCPQDVPVDVPRMSPWPCEGPGCPQCQRHRLICGPCPSCQPWVGRRLGVFCPLLEGKDLFFNPRLLILGERGLREVLRLLEAQGREQWSHCAAERPGCCQKGPARGFQHVSIPLLRYNYTGEQRALQTHPLPARGCGTHVSALGRGQGDSHRAHSHTNTQRG